MHEIVFQPDGLRISVETGTLLTSAMTAAGMNIQLACGGTGKCGKCVVEITPDPPEPGDFDRLHIAEELLSRGKRLACKTRVDRDMTVYVGESMRALGGKILVDGAMQEFEHAPAVTKRYLVLPESSLDDQAPDLFRVKRALAFPDESCPGVSLDLLRELSAKLRANDMEVTVVATDDRIVDIEPGDTSSRLYGIAFDIGTTTVVGTILDLVTGAEVSHASRLNAQVIYGEDTISRIKHAIENPGGIDDLRVKILSVINDIIQDAARSAGISVTDIYEAVCVGNTTMSHLLLGLNPSGLSMIPFVPVTNAAVEISAADAGFNINPRGAVHVLPNIAGFVGADTVGVMLACSYLEPGATRLAVDVGTNGELALAFGDKLMVCSTAAGPALEGAALTCGMRAALGAIDHVTVEGGDIGISVIGGTRPSGLCGSGIIDALAVLLETGVVDSFGAFRPREELDGVLAGAMLGRLVVVDGQPAFRFDVGGEDDGSRRDVVLTQRDVRQIQLAKGAIAAGIVLLLAEMGLTVDDIDELLLAGAFGNYITPESARRIGLLPDIPLERIRFVGNAASAGAKAALLSKHARRDADTIRSRTGHLELANLPGFMSEMTDQMLFPDTT